MTRSNVVKKVLDTAERHSGGGAESDTAWEAASVCYLGAATAADGPPLPATVSELAAVVNELKEQLKDLVRVNEALELDLEQMRKQTGTGEGELQHPIQGNPVREEDAGSMEELRAEVGHLSRERDRLAGRVQDLSRALYTSEQRVKEAGGLLDRFRAERDDATAEATCLNLQFSRAMKVIDQIRGEQASSHEREAELRERILALEKQLEKVVGQRDSFRSDLAASRAALKEVRQSILAASEESERGRFDD